MKIIGISFIFLFSQSSLCFAQCETLEVGRVLVALDGRPHLTSDTSKTVTRSFIIRFCEQDWPAVDSAFYWTTDGSAVIDSMNVSLSDKALRMNVGNSAYNYEPKFHIRIGCFDYDVPFIPGYPFCGICKSNLEGIIQVNYFDHYSKID